MTSPEARVELLRPKTVPEGLLAWGIVVDISEIQVKLQITGGIICLVDRLNVSESFSELLQNSNKHIPLSQIFCKGQQYVCKIIEKRSRKGYIDAKDIIATLDPSAIQEDNIPATLFSIPFVPLQCAVKSIEDHGYQLDVGFKGLTGFLPYEECEEYCKENNKGKKFTIGQVVRCYSAKTITSAEDLRVVQLSMSESSRVKSEFSQDKVNQVALTEKCILPGSQAFLTVMKVKKDGLVVNFLNEFSGSVTSTHLKDEWHIPKTDYKISQKFKCTVLYYNSLTKTFALSIKGESKFRKTSKYLHENHHVGQMIKNAEVVQLNGTRSILFKINNYKAVANVMDALNQEVATMTKDELHNALEEAYPEHSKHKCRIKSINFADQTLVVSLKKEFLTLPYVSVEELKPADFIEAKVKKIVKDGIIVTFGLNLRAIILDINLNDAKTPKMYPVGKTIKCRVLKVDIHKQPARVYVTNKEQLMDPYMTVIDSYDKSFKGESTNATIIKVSPAGLIVELFNNIKGFLPRIFLSSEGVPKTSIGHLFEVGQVTSCVVYRVDPIRPSLLLGLIPLAQILKMKQEKKMKKKVKKAEKIQEKQDKAVENVPPENQIKSRRQRSEEARLREEKIRELEKQMLDPNRPPQSIPDFEKLVLKTPNSADSWIKYSKFFLDNVETEKARIVCRRALRTINFRMEKEKLKVWLYLIKIEAKFGGSEKLKETIGEAAQVNDKIELYKGTSKILSNCGELDEAEHIHEMLLKLDSKSVDIWIDYIQFLMENRKNLDQARALYEKALKILLKSDIVTLKSRFAQLEFRLGDVERGKTLFENLLSDNPKRTDLWRVYEGMIKKFAARQVDNEEIRAQNQATLQRISESIELVSKKSKKLVKKSKKAHDVANDQSEKRIKRVRVV